MKKNNLIITIVASILLGALGFWGGIQYQKNKLSQFSRGFNDGTNMKGQTGDRTVPSGISQVRGTILNKDGDTITVKLQDDSSKIIILNDTTVINKTEDGSLEDLVDTEEIFVFGKTNSDGSVTADNIQIGTNMIRTN